MIHLIKSHEWAQKHRVWIARKSGKSNSQILLKKIGSTVLDGGSYGT